MLRNVFTEKCHNNIKSKYYIRPKSDAICFAIHHFAGRVVYQAENFLEKNRNFLPTEVIQLIRSSKFEMVRFLFQCPITKTGNLCSIMQDTPTPLPLPPLALAPPPPQTLQTPSSLSLTSSSSSSAHMLAMQANAANNNFNRNDTTHSREPSYYNSRGLASQSRVQQTVACTFRYSLMDLLQKMVAGSPQFVRCIKPNDYQQSKRFDAAKVLKQLRCAGVLETIRIRQNGFSHRLTFAEFLKRYCFLAFGFVEKVTVSRENCRLLLVRLKMDGWALGKSKGTV